jgi:hypothetical protein
MYFKDSKSNQSLISFLGAVKLEISNKEDSWKLPVDLETKQKPSC